MIFLSIPIGNYELRFIHFISKAYIINTYTYSAIFKIRIILKQVKLNHILENSTG